MLTRVRKISLFFVQFLVALLLGITFSELLVRAFVPNAKDERVPNCFILNTNPSFRPNCSFVGVGPFGEYTVHSNAFGLIKTFGDEAKGNKRVAILGDSISEGMLHKEGDRIADLLSKQILAPKNYGSWNFSLRGTGSLTLLNRYEQIVKDLNPQPNRIIWFLNATDSIDDLFTFERSTTASNDLFFRSYTAVPVSLQWLDSLTGNTSHLLPFLIMKTKEFFMQKTLGEIDIAENKSCLILRRFVERNHHKGTKIVFILLNTHQPEANYFGYNLELVNTEKNVDCIAPHLYHKIDLRALPRSARDMAPDGLHFTPEYNRTLVDEIQKQLPKEFLQ